MTTIYAYKKTKKLFKFDVGHNPNTTQVTAGPTRSLLEEINNENPKVWFVIRTPASFQGPMFVDDTLTTINKMGEIMFSKG